MRDSTLLKFIVVGLTAAASEYGLFIVMSHYGYGLIVSNILSFVLGLTISFSLNRSWSFKAAEPYAKPVARQFGAYSILALVNIFISTALIEILVTLHLRAAVAKVIAMAMIAGYNFVIFKFRIFNQTAIRPLPTSPGYAGDLR